MADIIKISELPSPICSKRGALSKDDLRAKAEALTEVYNDAVQNGNRSPIMEYPGETPEESIGTAYVRDVIEQCVNEYTSIARDECLSELVKAEDPMLAAVKRLTFNTIRITDKLVGEKNAKIPVSSIEESERYIDSLTLHKKVDGGIGKNKNWNAITEKFNFLMTAQTAIDLKVDPKEINDSYVMSDIARQIDMGKTPTSKTNLLKTLQSVVTAMIGEEYKVTSHEVNYLLKVYNRKSRKALTVSCANHKQMRQYLMEICHAIVTGSHYGVDCRKYKK